MEQTAIGKNSKTFSCFVIGECVVPCLECVQILTDRGHRVYGFISLDRTLSQWASERNIPFLAIDGEGSSDREIVNFLSQHPFEYLFSIENYYILNKKILKLPQKGAINYHNSLLPKYAGCEVEYWAIVNREKIHGITWHLMGKRVDSGGILKQVSFPIVPTETAYSLNEKCDRAAVKSFYELIEELASDRVSVTQQNLKERTYYAFSKRPSVGCIFSWNLSAEDIDIFIRALTYVSHTNYVGTPKIAIDNEFIIVSKIRVLNFKSNDRSGTITKIQSDSIQVSTITNDVLITEIFTIDGQILPVSQAISKFSLFEGYQFVNLDSVLSDRLTECYIQVLKEEEFWLRKFFKLQPVFLEQNNAFKYCTNSKEYIVDRTLLPDEIVNLLGDEFSEGNSTNFILSVFAIYLHLSQQTSNVEFGYGDEKIKREFHELEGFFAVRVPFSIKIDDRMTFRNLTIQVQKEVRSIQEHKIYCRDIFFRYPKLGCRENYQFSTIVERVENLDNLTLESKSDLTLFVPERGNGYAWRYVRGILDSEMEIDLPHRINSIASQAIQNLDGEISKII